MGVADCLFFHSDYSSVVSYETLTKPVFSFEALNNAGMTKFPVFSASNLLLFNFNAFASRRDKQNNFKNVKSLQFIKQII